MMKSKANYLDEIEKLCEELGPLIQLGVSIIVSRVIDEIVESIPEDKIIVTNLTKDRLAVEGCDMETTNTIKDWKQQFLANKE